jgi:uncharacterized protein (DUF2141 family)
LIRYEPHDVEGDAQRSSRGVNAVPIRSIRVRKTEIDADGQSVTGKLSFIPYGDYGIAVFHDENSNGKMDKNFLGMP